MGDRLGGGRRAASPTQQGLKGLLTPRAAGNSERGPQRKTTVMSAQMDERFAQRLRKGTWHKSGSEVTLCSQPGSFVMHGGHAPPLSQPLGPRASSDPSAQRGTKETGGLPT